MSDNPAAQIRDLSRRIIHKEEVTPEELREALKRLRSDRGFVGEKKKAREAAPQLSLDDLFGAGNQEESK